MVKEKKVTEKGNPDPESKVEDKKLTIDQILNEMKVSGRLRKVAESKFINDTHTKSEWVELFKNNRFDF